MFKLERKRIGVAIVCHAVLLGGCFGSSVVSQNGASSTSTSSSSTSSSSTTGGSTSSACDSSITSSSSGSLAIDLSNGLVPLCDGEAYVGDSTTNEVVKLNVFTGSISNSYALSDTPKDLVYDSTNNFLYASLVTATEIAKIDLGTGTVSTIPITGGTVDHLVAGGNGTLFASLKPTSGSYSGPIAVINGVAGTVAATISGTYSLILGFDPASNTLFTADEGLSPSALTQYTYNSSSYTLTQAQKISNAGGNGSTIAVSPSGSQIAYVDGGGNGSPPYTIYDDSASNINTVNGAWNTGAYPAGGDFSLNGQYFGSTNESNTLYVFNATTHTAQKTDSVSLCAYGQLFQARFSQGSKVLFALTKCGSPASSGYIYWTTVQ